MESKFIKKLCQLINFERRVKLTGIVATLYRQC